MPFTALGQHAKDWRQSERATPDTYWPGIDVTSRVLRGDLQDELAPPVHEEGGELIVVCYTQ
jgi:hypothetical protein